MNDARSAFWDFSLRFYAEPGVAAACLELQDGGGADVNVLLYLFYLATHGRYLDRNDMARLDAAVAPWRDQVVRPLRTTRRHLKTPPAAFAGDAAAALRSDIKRDELAAERIQQHVIEALFPPAAIGAPMAPRASAVRASVTAYAAHLGTLPADAVASLIEIFDRT